MPGLGRHAKKGNRGQKAGGVDTGRAKKRAATAADPVLAAEVAARIALARTAAAEARKRSAELKPSAEAAQARQKKRHQRDGTAPPGETPKAPMREAAGPTTRGGQPRELELPKDLGATTAGRHSAFAREGRKADAARQAAERQQRKLSDLIKRHLAKGRYSIAAAALGGAVRDPAVRPLLRAAGLILSEDAAMDTQLVDRIAEVSGPAGSGKGAQTYDNSRAVGLVATLCAPNISPRKEVGGRQCRTPGAPSVAPGQMSHARRHSSHAIDLVLLRSRCLSLVQWCLQMTITRRLSRSLPPVWLKGSDIAHILYVYVVFIFMIVVLGRNGIFVVLRYSVYTVSLA